MENSPPPRVPERLIVAYPPAVVASDEDPKHPMPPLPNYISQEEPDEPDEPTFQRRSRRVAARSFTQEAILTAVEITTCHLDPAKLAQRKFPKQLICELAGAVMDRNGDLLEYRHLMKRDEYKQIWGHGYGNEISHLAQGMPGRVDGTDTIHFIHKLEVPRDRAKLQGWRTVHLQGIP